MSLTDVLIGYDYVCVLCITDIKNSLYTWFGFHKEYRFQNAEEIDWDKYWNPKIYVENNLGEPKETIWQTLMFNARGEATIYERRRIKGCFLENLELDEFPFDTQVKLN